MSPPRSPISEKELARLAAGSGDLETIERLVTLQHSAHAVLLWGVQHAAREQGLSEAARTRDAFELLRDLQRSHPDHAGTVLRFPSVGAWARATLRRLEGGPGLPGTPLRAAEPAGMAAIAAAAAARSGLRCAIDVPVVDGGVTLPSLGRADMDGTSARFLLTGDGAELSGSGVEVAIPEDFAEPSPRWRGLRRMDTAGPSFLLDDVDPFRIPGVRPAGRLNEAELARWRLLLCEAWELLTQHHRAYAAEIRAVVQVVTPLPARPNRGWSATSPAAFGSVAISPPSDTATLAVTLAHEVQHAKLVAILDAVDLVEAGSDERFYAPWRDDPRPLHGLLHGAYAHLGVAGFWRRQRHLEDGSAAVRAHASFARWRAASAQVTEFLLGTERLTPLGREFVQHMLTTLRAWEDEYVPPRARRLADREADRHRAEWRHRNRRAR